MATMDANAGIHILIVDDDQLVRDFAVQTIEYGTNRKVTTLDNGFKAWQFIQNQPEVVDIVIADANIPDMDGLELLGHVKKTYPRKRFILSTSNPSFENKAYQLGADAFLSKPYDVNDLFTILEKFYIDADSSSKSNVTTFPSSEGINAAVDQ